MSLSALQRFGNITFPLNFVQSVLCTFLIVWPLYKQYLRGRKGDPGSRNLSSDLGAVARIVVESAAIYMFQMCILIVLWALNHTSIVIVHAALTPSIGL